MNTQFAESINPWTRQRMTKDNKPRKTCAPTSVDDITFTNDKPTQRVAPEGKYTAIFAHAHETGQRIKCKPAAAQAISNGARKWVEKNGHAAKVSATSNYAKDGQGGVWIIQSAAPK